MFSRFVRDCIEHQSDFAEFLFEKVKIDMRNMKRERNLRCYFEKR